LYSQAAAVGADAQPTLPTTCRFAVCTIAIVKVRASAGAIAVCVMAVLAWSSPSAAAATPGAPKQIAIADGPRGALLGLLDAEGNVWAKYVNSSNWTLEFSGGQSEMAVADGPHGPVIGRLDSNGIFWAKAGGLSAAWVHEQNAVKQIAVADGSDGPMVGYIDAAGTFYAKVGGLSATWTHMYGGGSLGTVSAIALADGSGGPDYGALTSTGAFLAKTGVGSAWTTEGDGVSQISLADGPHGATLGMLSHGIFSAKTGGTGGTLVNVYNGGQTAMAVGDGPHGPLLGRLDAAGMFAAKDGSLSAPWTDEFGGGQTLIALADGSDLGRVDSAGGFYVKSRGLSTAWQQEVAPLPAPAPPPAPTPSPPTVTQTTPVPKAPGAIRTRFEIRWHFDPRGTVLRSVRVVSGLPAHARVSVRCAGRHCPRVRGSAIGRRAVRRLLGKLAGRRFSAGDRLFLTVTAPGRRAERIALTIRRERKPLGRVLSA
jgi:hypothetical protein